MNEAQAAVGRVQLRKLDMMTEKRRANSHYLTEGLKDIKGLTTPYEDPNCFSSYHLYTLCIEEEELGDLFRQYEVLNKSLSPIVIEEFGVVSIQHYFESIILAADITRSSDLD